MNCRCLAYLQSAATASISRSQASSKIPAITTVNAVSRPPRTSFRTERIEESVAPISEISPVHDQIVESHAGGLERRFDVIPGEPALRFQTVRHGTVDPDRDLGPLTKSIRVWPATSSAWQ